MSTTVIVGASVAGIRTAQSLRSQGYSGSIYLLDAEDYWPYDKPPLSKGYLHGGESHESITLISRDEVQQLDITLLLNHRAVGLDVEARTLEIEGRGKFQYDNLVIATGGHARPSPWGQRPGLMTLRTLDDADSLRSEISPGQHLAIIGAGFIGAEIAATARTIGAQVTLIDPLPYPMSRILTAEVGGWFTQLHRNHGVNTKFGVGVEEVTGNLGNFCVSLTDGQEIQADVVLVGIGSQPNDKWLADSGLLIDNGVVCDEYCRTVNVPEIYVAGDVARFATSKARAEHWTNAIEQAHTVAHNIVHPSDLEAHKALEYVWSDQYDWKIQVVGNPHHEHDHTIIGDPDTSGRAAAVCAVDGKIKGAVIVNWPRALLEIRKALMQSSDLQPVLKRLRFLENQMQESA